MNKSKYELNERISAILINPYLSIDEFNINCNLIKKYNIKNISTTLNYISDVKKSLGNHKVKINTLISFPLGDLPSIVIDQMIDYSIDQGANGIEYLPKFFYLSKNEEEKFANDIEIISKKKLPLTLIFNQNRMREKVFIKAINIALELGIKFFQFGDGFGSTLNGFDIQEIKKLLNDKSCIKVSGKVRNIENAIELLDHGADIISTSYFHDIFLDVN